MSSKPWRPTRFGALTEPPTGIDAARHEYRDMNITGSLPLHDLPARGVRPGEPGYFFSSIVVPWF